MFYMLWEAQNHYSILVTFMLLILSIDGLTWIVRYRKKVAEKHGMRIEKTGCWVVVAALGVIVIALICGMLIYIRHGKESRIPAEGMLVKQEQDGIVEWA